MKKYILFFAIGVLYILACYKGHGLSPTSPQDDNTGIQGHITFQGEWPDSTREVQVAVFKDYPYGITDTDSLLVFVINAYIGGELFLSDTIPRFSTEYDYILPLEPDTYAWVLVIWYPDILNYREGVKELGAYYANPDDMKLPSPVRVMPGVLTPNIDITADFTNINRELPFFRAREEN